MELFNSFVIENYMDLEVFRLRSSPLVLKRLIKLRTSQTLQEYTLGINMFLDLTSHG